MRSVAAWGTIPIELPIKSKKNGKKTIIHSNLKAGIGIDYDPATSQIQVATVFYAKTEKEPFTKKGAYARLVTKMDASHPQTILFKGKWIGDPLRVKTELFAALTGFFRQVILCVCSEIVNPTNIDRGKESVPDIRAAIIGWLIENKNISFETVNYTKQKFTPYWMKGSPSEESSRKGCTLIYLSLKKKIQEQIEGEKAFLETLNKFEDLDKLDSAS